jgi:hypothetical protein
MEGEQKDPFHYIELLFKEWMQRARLGEIALLLQLIGEELQRRAKVRY